MTLDIPPISLKTSSLLRKEWGIGMSRTSSVEFQRNIKPINQ